MVKIGVVGCDWKAAAGADVLEPPPARKALASALALNAEALDPECPRRVERAIARKRLHEFPTASLQYLSRKWFDGAGWQNLPRKSIAQQTS